MYSHEFFQRDRPELLDHLRRKTNSLHQKRLQEDAKVLAEANRQLIEAKSAAAEAESQSAVPFPLGLHEESTELEMDIDDEASATDIVSPDYADSPGALVPCEFLPRPLQDFCVRRNPWRNPQLLSSEIRSLLNLSPDLEAEFYEYVRALESPDYVGSVRFNEVILLRYFMMFAVTRLQMTKFFLEERCGRDGNPETASDLQVVSTRLDAWLSYTKSCI